MTQIDDNVKTYINHNVYILGAGFCADAGLPLINNFLYEMRACIDWLIDQPERKSEFEAIRDVFKFRKDAASAALRVNLNIENIEDLFSLAAASGQYPLSQSVSTAIAATLDYSRSTTPARNVNAMVDDEFPKPSGWKMHDPDVRSNHYSIPLYDIYAGLLSGVLCEPERNMRNTIITFNYDTILEKAFANLGVPFDYRLGKGAVNSSKVQALAEGNDIIPINLLKLHGSVNWAGPSKGGEITVFDDYSDNLKEGRSAFLIPPTWRKDFTGAMGNIWDNAVNALSEATRIIFMGFSMPPTDIHIKYLLAAGLQNNISLRNLFFFNPGKETEDNLFKIMRSELKDQHIVEFHQLSMKDIIFLPNKDFQRPGYLFNRALSHHLTDLTQA